MPIKNLSLPFARDGVTQRNFKFGGGAEIVFTANEDENMMLYPIGYSINTRGGNDTIYGSDIGAPGSGIGDDLTGGDGSDTIFGGGGDDTIRGGNADGSDASKGQQPAPTNILVGDGEWQADGSYTADVNFIDGIAFVGGNDTIFGGDGATTNTVYGDAANVNMVTGLNFTGGNDDLTGGVGAGTNNMFGDATIVSTVAGATFDGGNDTLVANDGLNSNLVGDTNIISGDGTFNGGNDRLISGTGNDVMVGDWANDNGFTGTATGGADTFVFAADNGFDSIADFEAGKDKIDLSALLVAPGVGISFGTFDTNFSGVLDAGDFAVNILGGTTTQLDLGLATGGGFFQDLLTISDVTGLVATDFDFV